MKKGNKNKRYTNINEWWSGEAYHLSYHCWEDIILNKHRTKPLFPRIGQQACRMWSLRARKNKMSSAFQTMTQRNETQRECCCVGMRKLIGGWALRELVFIGRNWGVGLALDISRGFHFVHSWILHAPTSLPEAWLWAVAGNEQEALSLVEKIIQIY